MLKKITLQSDVKLIGNIVLPLNTQKGVVILHGGGIGCKEQFTELQEYLAQRQVASLAFDFRGVGESEGTFKEGNLIKRLKDAQVALDTFSSYVPKQNISIIGVSMGGHIAARLTENNPEVHSIILLYAAAYGKRAEDKPLNHLFTAEIRKENSWIDSLAFTTLRKYKNPILIMYGEHELIIPEGVKSSYKKIMNEKSKYVILKDATHSFITDTKNKLIKEKVYKEILVFI